MPVAKRRQQKNVSVMVWAGIVDQTIIGSFKVNEGVKLDSANYCDFRDKSCFAWYKSQSCSFKMKCIMYDSAPSHVYKLTHEFFEHKRFAGEKITDVWFDGISTFVGYLMPNPFLCK